MASCKPEHDPIRLAMELYRKEWMNNTFAKNKYIHGPKMKNKRPLQPIVKAKDNVYRFQQNNIVRYLLDAGPFTLNYLATLSFSKEDWEQFAQLIGYSVSGFGDLSYAKRSTVAAADKIVTEMIATRKRGKK